ncbi:MAG: serine/threonine protein kinase [Candidatus Xenobiia bacterium LiM19]
MPALLPIGTVLRSRYKINKIIFESMLVNVYYVVDLHFPEKGWVVREMQMVAVDSQDRARSIKRFNQEASQISSLSHPYIATVVDYFTEGTNYYIVREFIHGNDLITLLKMNQKPFLEHEVVAWAVQIADALSFLYSNKFSAVFFREFHMGNIMLSTNGSIKLIDLGLAGVFQTDSDSTNLNRLGSMDYASPEQFIGDGTFDSRSLVYSLGAFMYHALTSVNPASSPFELKPIHLLNPTLSGGVLDVIRKSTQIDSKLRYQSISDMKRDLISMLKSPRSSPVKTVDTKEKENPISNWLLGVLLIIIMGTTLFLIYYYFLRP